MRLSELRGALRLFPNLTVGDYEKESVMAHVCASCARPVREEQLIDTSIGAVCLRCDSAAISAALAAFGEDCDELLSEFAQVAL